MMWTSRFVPFDSSLETNTAVRRRQRLKRVSVFDLCPKSALFFNSNSFSWSFLRSDPRFPIPGPKSATTFFPINCKSHQRRHRPVTSFVWTDKHSQTSNARAPWLLSFPPTFTVVNHLMALTHRFQNPLFSLAQAFYLLSFSRLVHTAMSLGLLVSLISNELSDHFRRSC
ncbi:hypothetical protein TRVL_05644 [Trypanosoma vivax]|nr:hypothetical protein TRVL_05644 [Trypanosoma vivax]